MCNIPDREDDIIIYVCRNRDITSGHGALPITQLQYSSVDVGITSFKLKRGEFRCAKARAEQYTYICI